ncbi:CRISPR-associated endonuclease Cas4g/Cas1g [Haliangium sp.]|uniref:CRISPR-associated endonuclease Cas4g/Cas1g n=1 Tax=Haliangium sp. TaxID=2663208 RepID=UPI003D0EF318
MTTGAAPRPSERPLLPVRMLNEFTYCPRLFHLEWVQREWADNADTLDGKRVHRRVDKPSARGLSAPDPGSTEADDDGMYTQHARSVSLGDDGLGLIATIDVVEAEGDLATPIDYKRSKRPDVPGGAYEPERVQVCAQGLLLRAHGFRSERGILYFAGSRDRVEIPFTETLVARTLELRDQARVAAEAAHAPPPLVDSPKCPRCSLVGICLPDEQNALLGRSTEGVVRPLAPPRDDALPLHVQHHGAVVSKRASELVVKCKDREPTRVRLKDVSRINLHGSAHITLPALRAALGSGIPVGLFSYGGWYYGKVQGHDHKNVLLRQAQYAAAADPERCLVIARRLVRAKIKNARVLLRRNCRALDRRVLDDLSGHIRRAGNADNVDSLLGIEGSAARVYFQYFAGMLRQELPFGFEGRNRRPPRDPVNALLSFSYALLTSEWTAALSVIGFDPYLGFYHQPRYGRPSLSLDLMEEFRPIIADSVVINAVNNGVVGAGDFVLTATAAALTPAGKRRFIQTFERRMDELVTHPVFGYRISYRRVLDVQARLLGRYLMGEIDEFPEMVVR